MTAHAEGLGGATEVLHGGGHNIDHLDGMDEGLDRVEAVYAQLLLHCLGRGGIGIVEPCQLVAAGLFDAFDMDLAEMAGA